jgi:nucleoside-diphosphate-sugar epimerase/predicted dehydrogenase
MYNVGLLGAGYIAAHHLKALKNLPQVRVVCVCDISFDKAREFAQANPGMRAYDSQDKMLSEEKLDAVHVLIPPESHQTSTEKILRAGKHVFLEKPMGVTKAECQSLVQAAQDAHVQLGVNHNFLFYPVYQKLQKAIAEHQLGRLDHLVITWHRKMDQIQQGPFGIWMLKDPANLWIENGSHLCSMALGLVPELTNLSVETNSMIELPTKVPVYRRWLARGQSGNTSVELRASFTQGFEERSIEVRGQGGSARVDFDQNTFILKRHTRYSLPFDTFAINQNEANRLSRQGFQFIKNYIFSKIGLSKFGDPYAGSIYESIACFYRNLPMEVNRYQSGPFGTDVIGLCNEIIAKASLQKSSAKSVATKNSSSQEADTLVLGGAGFIGQALVKQLLQAGQSVRVLVRDPDKLAPLRGNNLDCIHGDILDAAALKGSMRNIKQVYHLARARVNRWGDYLKKDIEATRMIGEACLENGIQRLVYTGTIDSYYAGKADEVITEETPLDPKIQWRNYYAQSKAAGENLLLAMHADKKLPLVIVRPGIVIGSGSDPFHWGIGMWHYETVCQIWGKGEHPLPFVLVDDVAKGLMQAMEKQGIEGESFNFIDDPCLSAREYLQALEKALDVKITTLPTPIWRFFMTGSFKWAMKVVVRHRERQFSSWRDWQSRTQQALFNCAKSKQVLNWMPAGQKEMLIEEGINKPAREWWA